MSQVVVEMPVMVNISEVARQLGLCRQTVYNWIAQGKLHPVPVGGQQFVLAAEIERVRAERGK